MPDADALQTEVLVVGGGAAGMFAALYAARFGAGGTPVYKNVVSRGRDVWSMIWSIRSEAGPI